MTKATVPIAPALDDDDTAERPPSWKEQLAEMPHYEIEQHLDNDLAAGWRFVKENGEDARFCWEKNKWYAWDGMRWRQSHGAEIANLADATTVKIIAELQALMKDYREQNCKVDEDISNLEDKIKDETDKDLITSHKTEISALRREANWRKGEITKAKKAINMAQSRKRRDNMIEMAKGPLSIEREHFDAIDHLIVLNNGVVDLRTGNLLKHQREFLIGGKISLPSRLCPVEYDQECLSDELLERVLSSATSGDQEVQRYLQKALGASVFGNNRFEQFWLCIGPGGSGKGTLFRSIEEALGDYATTASFQTFTRIRGQRNDFDLADLAGYHLVISSEANRGDQFDGQRLKTLTGRDNVKAANKFESLFRFSPRLSLWLQANDKPRIEGDDSGLRRRLVVVPFGKSIPDDQRDPGVKDQMMDPERGGKAVIAWLIAGACAVYGSQSIPTPDAIAEETKRFWADADHLGDWMRDNLLLADPENDRIFGKTFAANCDMVRLAKAYVRTQTGFEASSEVIRGRLSLLGLTSRRKRFTGADRKYNLECWIGVTLRGTDHLAHHESCQPGEEYTTKALAIQTDEDETEESQNDTEPAQEKLFPCSDVPGQTDSAPPCVRARTRGDQTISNRNIGTLEHQNSQEEVQLDGDPEDLMGM